jgi:hypothetical protein
MNDGYICTGGDKQREYCTERGHITSCAECGFNLEIHQQRVQRLRTGGLVTDEVTGLRFLPLEKREAEREGMQEWT